MQCRVSLNKLIWFHSQVEKVNYIQSELNKLEREQEAIDQKANALEKKLRAVMGGTMTSKCPLLYHSTIDMKINIFTFLLF